MGYHTEFWDSLSVEPPLNADEISYLTAFNDSRRMKRANGPLFVGGPSDYGHGPGTDVVDANEPPAGQPNLWVGWKPTEDGAQIVWDESENTYGTPQWIAFLVHRLLGPAARPYVDAHAHEDPRLASFTCDHVLSGRIEAQGEEGDDRWGLSVDNGIVTVLSMPSLFEPVVPEVIEPLPID